MKLFSVLLRYFGLRRKDAETFSTTLNDGFTLSDIPEAFPALESVHTVATDLKSFRVARVDTERSNVFLLEEATGLEYKLNLDTFDLLFVSQNNP